MSSKTAEVSSPTTTDNSLFTTTLMPIAKSQNIETTTQPEVDVDVGGKDTNTQMPKKESIVEETTTLITPDENLIDEEREVLSVLRRDTIDEEDIDDFMVVEDFYCDLSLKPKESETCFHKPCAEHGNVEWIVSSWSSCNVECGPRIQTRQVVCATRDGTIYSDDICFAQHGTKPADSQDCPFIPCGKSIWFTSEWSDCSVQCGTGIKTRNVFCGHVHSDDGEVRWEEDDHKCNKSTKPPKATICSIDLCKNEIFSGPLGPCNLPCGVGLKSRTLFCYNQSEDGLVHSEHCDFEQSLVSKTESCNVDSCDDDQIALVFDCKDTEFGCCPTDGSTPADVDMLNCPPLLSTESCLDSEFGCCTSSSQDGNTVMALGPFGLGCAVNCTDTRYGCCPDGITIANTTDLQDCPPIPCDDCDLTTTTTMAPTTTEAVTLPLAGIGPKCSGDEEGSGGDGSACTESISVKDCSSSRFGCCPDGWSEAQGPNGDGCEDGSGDQNLFITSTLSSVGKIFTTLLDFYDGADTTTTPLDSDDCSQTEFGCCPNGIKKATGPRYYGCTCHECQYQLDFFLKVLKRNFVFKIL